MHSKIKDTLLINQGSSTNFPTHTLKGLTELKKEGSVVVIITDGDIRRAIELYGEALFSMRVGEIISRQPMTVEVETRMEDALSLMESRKITSLLVTDGTSIVGVVKK